MNQMYDVIIIGCGEAGIYAGYELSLKILLKIGFLSREEIFIKEAARL